MPGLLAHVPQTRRDRFVVVPGGDTVLWPHLRKLPESATVIAVDSGLTTARQLNLAVDLIVGDLDSVDPAELAAAEASGIPVDRHPVAKDSTDLQIALDIVANEPTAREVVVVGGHGGRLDHLLGASMLLANPAYRHLHISALMGSAIVTVVHTQAVVTGYPGELVSLIPVNGPARGVRTTGLQYPLNAEDLAASSTRGVSNVFTDTTATVELAAGTLLAVQPAARTPQARDTPGGSTNRSEDPE